ncbi:hypothetical protein [Brachybacterium paraconglomeratum]|uniref:hypothetical protein n=1 Tax=Brachybacterium paraconglomeratum TaxID=173362 RepID=UPI00026C6F0D|nr:hypothetical protein [Brachybacterium paraconglomeratum]
MTSATSPTPPDARDPEGVPPASGPKSWSKGKLAGIIGGGCCGLILLAVIGIVILGTIIGPDDDAEPPASATTTEEPAATEEEPAVEETAEEEAPSEEPTSEAAEEPTEETTEAEAEAPAEDPEAWASEIEASALMGSADWQEMCGGDYSLGACWISDVTSTSVGTLDVTLQLNGSDPEAKGLAEGAANIIFSTAGPAHEDLEWVVVYDASGVVIDQKKRSDYPLLEG